MNTSYKNAKQASREARKVREDYGYAKPFSYYAFAPLASFARATP